MRKLCWHHRHLVAKRTVCQIGLVTNPMLANKQSCAQALVYRGCILQSECTYFNWFGIERRRLYSILSWSSWILVYSVYFFFLSFAPKLQHKHRTDRKRLKTALTARQKSRTRAKAKAGVKGRRSAVRFWVIRTVGRLPTNWGDDTAISSFKGPRKQRRTTGTALAW